MASSASPSRTVWSSFWGPVNSDVQKQLLRVAAEATPGLSRFATVFYQMPRGGGGGLANPCDELEGMLAAQMVAAHNAAGVLPAGDDP